MRRAVLYTFGLAVVVIMIFFHFKYEEDTLITQETEAMEEAPEKAEAKIIEIENLNTNEDVEGKAEFKNEKIEIPSPLAKTVDEAISYLKTYADKNDYAKFILENREEYPDSLIKLAANRPNSLKFVKNYIDNKNTFQKFDSHPEETVALNRQFPLYILWDERWGYKEYEDVFCVLGCGPTTATMAINGYGGNANPNAIMDEMIEKRYYIKDVGTSWEGIRKILDKYGVASESLPTVEKKYKNHLDTGNAILINVAPSKFTNLGHYMLIVGYNENGYILNDSNSIEYSQQEVSFEELAQILKGAWTLRKK